MIITAPAQLSYKYFSHDLLDHYFVPWAWKRKKKAQKF
jgi:hypothetical protein